MKHIDCSKMMGACCSPIVGPKILFACLGLIILSFEGDLDVLNSVLRGQKGLDKVVVFIGGHVTDVEAKGAILRDMTGLLAMEASHRWRLTSINRQSLWTEGDEQARGLTYSQRSCRWVMQKRIARIGGVSRGCCQGTT
jgi:hypothetical protein